ncbi:hypothetical protein [Ramlibacter sp.]|uniref:hypothetical protein n=1 Tax=Ramlibacter sp. TaxID=1917967 RepID=UPI002D705793|nr:hypothetical protein [Ramlibacter sp.]HYD77254.1 hypothetical protein [Ramlibacter sp.]
MNRINAVTFAAVLAASLPAAAQHHGTGHGKPAEHATAASPYVGQEKREIKAMSEQEQRGWLEGQGMGLARAAELNGYPGPMHTLELADSIGLSPAQLAASRELMQRHKAEARALGVRLVETERQLDAAFREKRANDTDVERLTAEIAQIQGSIRASHLRTHLAQQRLLSAEQVSAYNRLRGYTQ